MYNMKYTSYESCDAIDAITTEDIVRVLLCGEFLLLLVGCEEIYVDHSVTCLYEL